MVNIKLIIGSTRPTRFGPNIANWLLEQASLRTDATFELVDLADIALPLLDEPEAALTGKYEKDHTKRWAALVDEADGFVFISPEYNHSYASPLKNAIDYLYTEWLHKPVAFASYGSAAGGARGVEHLRGVVGHLKMYDLSEHVIVPSYYLHLDERGQWHPTQEQSGQAKAIFDAVVFWARQMKTARQQLLLQAA